MQLPSHLTIPINATCVWGEPHLDIVNPFACYICEPLALNENDTLYILSDISETEIISVNFWLPWTAGYQWEIYHVPREIFKTFQRLKTLVLPGHIQEISSDDFVSAENLEHLELSNGIKSIPEFIFLHSPKLRRLNLSWNKIARISANAFNGLNHLKYLHLDRNRLAFLEKPIFSGIGNLTVLTASYNKIERIDDDALHLPNLIEIDLSNNKLRLLSNMTFNQCIKLQKVQLQSNELHCIGQALYQLQHLHHINLDKNHIEDISVESFASLSKLEYLSLQYNGHPPFDALVDGPMKNAHKSSIRELCLAANGLKSPHILRYLRRIGMKQLEKLDLDGNAFERIDFDVINDFPRLRQINLGQNQWNCDWLNDTVQKLENENIDINLYSSHFPMSINETHINYIQCV